jgi:hypothetical protein
MGFNKVHQIPGRDKYGQIDVEDVRQFMFDRTIEDNPLELDLVFDDDEINQAFRFAAMRYNETTPYVDKVDAAHLPYGMLFLNGIAYGLYLAKLQQLARQDIEYNSGNMTIDAFKRRLDHLQNFVKLFKESFEQMAKDRKISINIENAFRRF